MSKKRPRPRHDALRSLPQTAAAWLLGVEPRTVRTWKDAPRNQDGTYNAHDLVEWYIERDSTDPDPLLAGGSSPALERYRAARASREELELQARAGEVVPVENVQVILGAMASVARRGAVTAGRRWPGSQTFIHDLWWSMQAHCQTLVADPDRYALCVRGANGKLTEIKINMPKS